MSLPFGLRDRMDEGVNELSCTCGRRLYPDCDVSAASIVECFERHLIDDHGLTREQIETRCHTPRVGSQSGY